MEAEHMRWIVVSLGLILIGFNMATIVYARRITAAYHAWRLFFFGKTLITSYMVIEMYLRITNHADVSWRLPLCITGMIISGIAILWLGYEHKAIPFGRRSTDHIGTRRDD